MVPDEIARSPYVSLTTYRRSGDAVSTPVWAVRDGDDLLVWTKDDTGKVKRIRNSGRVTVTVCDARGRVADGAATAGGTARLLDASGLDRVRKAMTGKYGLRFRFLDVGGALVRLGKRPQVGIAITF
ncbi:PPOX class F420-dependent oxidoreductase [Streptomyces sp. H10-C2]|uniref:PPOX class F420-dependent oxidoreductase n=1 Tax=unclassified Streptomyces TaxID=2593676 RepID=UPI0024BAA87A|nr:MULTISPECIES: PPOX class F420-dependent oxidoreductase [unclassified Streptomyces]MDJ0342895.1 PPOX class F420-dependent oxidoreductase [Streptomyces sp. PH10-H1]MDJ0372668.1 PPOX class F420-dependent oxidoreductase [Streptomyces sp. H10-C2]